MNVTFDLGRDVGGVSAPYALAPGSGGGTISQVRAGLRPYGILGRHNHMSKVLVLHSGGLDSTVCLLLARERGHEVTSLGIDYGQRHRVELEFARMQCQRFGFERRLIRVEWDKPERPLPTDRSVGEMRASISPAFLPARNVVFLAVACAETAGIGADEVWLGVNAIDFSGYPDCTPQFVDAFRAMIAIAIPGGPKVVTPLIDLPKAHIAREAARLGIGSDDTWSCYRPQITSTGLSPCGRCDACILNRQAWQSDLRLVP